MLQSAPLQPRSTALSSLLLIPAAGRPLEINPEHSGAVVERSSEAAAATEISGPEGGLGME